MKLQPKKAPKKEERVYNFADPIQTALHTGDWTKTAQRPEKKCRECYGRGYTGYDIVHERYLVCGCVKYSVEGI